MGDNVKILYKEENEELFWDSWVKIVKSEQATFKYLKENINTYLSISTSRNFLVQDKSFVYIVDNEPRAIAFLPVESFDGNNAFSIVNSYLPAPLSVNEAIEKKVFHIIDELAIKHKVVKILFAINPLEKNVCYNFLQKYGYLDTSILNYVIDLNKNDNLLQGCRRGHKCDIKRMLNNMEFSVTILDKDNLDFDVHEEYRKLHYKCSGRETRPRETFDWQYQKLKNNNAVLVGLKFKDNYVAFSYFEYTPPNAVYFSGADDPDFTGFPVYHMLLFSSMEYLKKNGVNFIDTDQPSSPSPQFDYYPDKKQLNIAQFKRGFGGSFKDNHRGVKYFSKDVYEKDMKNFVRAYSDLLVSPDKSIY